VDVNEFGWLIGWVMECQEKGYITKEQLGGLEVKWGDAEAANQLLQMIIRREGFGNILAEGVKRASETVGGPAAECAIYTMKGDTPRGHDHRARWEEMLDTCTGSGGTIDSGPPVQQTELGQPARINPFDPEAVARMVGGTRGRRHFEDSLGTCIFTTRTTLAMLCRVLSAATGWEFTKDDAVTFGRRTAALMRAFNVRCGITPDLEKPSKRYGSVPVDGPARGQNVGQNWDHMVRVWYDTVGYDPETGKPFPATLEELGLAELIPALWG
jgi:aldehyde:ferredoxin oxidoreductase